MLQSLRYVEPQSGCTIWGGVTGCIFAQMEHIRQSRMKKLDRAITITLQNTVKMRQLLLSNPNPYLGWKVYHKFRHSGCNPVVNIPANPRDSESIMTLILRTWDTHTDRLEPARTRHRGHPASADEPECT